MLDLENTAVMYSMCLNHMGLAGLSGHLQAALSATAGWHFKLARLLCRSWHALRTDLLHMLPVEDNAEKKLDSLGTQDALKPANFPNDQTDILQQVIHY